MADFAPSYGRVEYRAKATITYLLNGYVCSEVGEGVMEVADDMEKVYWEGKDKYKFIGSLIEQMFNKAIFKGWIILGFQLVSVTKNDKNVLPIPGTVAFEENQDECSGR